MLVNNVLSSNKKLFCTLHFKIYFDFVKIFDFFG